MMSKLSILTSAAFLAAASQAAAQSAPSKLACSGSEPFWSLAIDGGRAIYKSGGADAAHTATEFVGKAAPVANRNPPSFAWRGVAPNGASVMVAFLLPAKCVVPSGDEVPWTIWLSLPQGSAVAGCCQ